MSIEISSALDERFLVIGCGSIGKRHLGNLIDLGVTDIAAFDVRDDRRLEIKERYGVPVFANLSSALDRNVQAALVCSPTHLHLEHALKAAEAGCHLFIEKPIANTLEGLDKLLKETNQRELRTLVGCNFRFHPGLRHAKSLLEEKIIGTVTSARAQFGQYLPDWHPWEDYRHGYSAQRSMGGGVVLDRIHEIDYLCWLLGEVSEVYAMLDHLSQLEIDTEDTAEILLRFTSGILGSIHADYVRRTYNCSLEIIGDEGTIQWRFQDHSVRWYCANDVTWHSLEWPRYDSNDMYVAEMQHFMRVLEGKDLSEVDVTEGKRVLSVALAAKQAAKDRKVVIL